MYYSFYLQKSTPIILVTYFLILQEANITLGTVFLLQIVVEQFFFLFYESGSTV